jgi:hypothetical protein
MESAPDSLYWLQKIEDECQSALLRPVSNAADEVQGITIDHKTNSRLRLAENSLELIGKIEENESYPIAVKNALTNLLKSSDASIGISSQTALFPRSFTNLLEELNKVFQARECGFDNTSSQENLDSATDEQFITTGLKKSILLNRLGSEYRLNSEVDHSHASHLSDIPINSSARNDCIATYDEVLRKTNREIISTLERIKDDAFTSDETLGTQIFAQNK